LNVSAVDFFILMTSLLTNCLH